MGFIQYHWTGQRCLESIGCIQNYWIGKQFVWDGTYIFQNLQPGARSNDPTVGCGVLDIGVFTRIRLSESTSSLASCIDCAFCGCAMD